MLFSSELKVVSDYYSLLTLLNIIPIKYGHALLCLQRWLEIYDDADFTATYTLKDLPGWERVMDIIRVDAERRRARRRKLKEMPEDRKIYALSRRKYASGT